MCHAEADDKPMDAEQGKRLKEVLDEWEKSSKSVREMHYRFTQTEDDRTFQTKTVRKGQVFVKMPELIRIDLTEPSGEATYVIYLKRQIHLFRTFDKYEGVLPLSEEYGFPEHPEKYPRKDFVESLLGWELESIMPAIMLQPPLGAAHGKSGFRLNKEDENWIYLDAKPQTKESRCDLKRYQVVLDAKTYQVRRIWFEMPNGSRIWYDFEKSIRSQIHRSRPRRFARACRKSGKESGLQTRTRNHRGGTFRIELRLPANEAS